MPLNGLGEEEIGILLRDLQSRNILRGVREDTWVLLSRAVRDSLGSDMELLEQLSNYGEVAE